jgi:uncharacterized protein DUF3891
MVVRPNAIAAPSSGTIAAWDAVLPTQQQSCVDGWLITQPDHAALAGDIAERLAPSLFPGLDAEVVRGITLHDEGWAEFDGQALASARAPRSFIAEAPATFVQAWTGSIERAAEISAIAGMIVSRHFWRLAKFRESHVKDSPDDQHRIEEFTAAEERRVRQLSPGCRAYDVETLTDVLQFCDVLSLYLCCGAGDDVEFPQEVRGQKIQLRRVRTGDEAAICRFAPAIFDSGVDLGIAARRATPDHAARQFLFVLE